ncbi:hypothetical protein BMWSH_0306 [Priestia megaterium WSH-002]|uniref:Uncharacterized protein n=1 Tax=Priestia megaterium (strain WSH-002) TaxID=1006007 RepID=A0A8D3WU69_PRIMW|nr:hypothetical protein BMWSH_0306 [Priestia megaterium WSH-002]
MPCFFMRFAANICALTIFFFNPHVDFFFSIPKEKKIKTP